MMDWELARGRAARVSGWTIACTLLVGGATKDARATADYPQLVADTLKLSTVPACTLCHTSLSGGRGTVRGGTPFGTALYDRGARSGDPQSVVRALQALEAAGTSSLKDGVPDVQKLREGRDPNVAGATTSSLPPPEYGCGARFAGRAPVHVRDVSWVLALVPLAWWRRRSARVAGSGQHR